MKRIMLTAIALTLAAPAYAQSQTTPPPAQTTPPAQTETKPDMQETKPMTTDAGSGERFMQAQMKEQWLASRLIGRQVYNAGGEEIGDVNDVVVTNDGDVAAVVVGVGGFLGLGEKRVAVNWDYVTNNGGITGERLVMGLTEEELRAAPEFAVIEEDTREQAGAEKTTPAQPQRTQ